MTGTSVEVIFRDDRDVESWSHRHAAGEVPSRWPYGLDLLARSGARLTHRELPEPSRVQSVLGRLRSTTRRGSDARQTSGSRDIGFAWDENLARRMLRLSAHPEMYAGVIWLTDLLGRAGADTERALRVLRSMSGLVVTCSAQVEPLAAAVGRGGPGVTYVPFGVDEVFFRPQTYPDRPLVLSAGVDRDRDHGTLFAALEEVHRARPEVELVVQAPGDARPPPGVRTVPRMSHAALRELYGRASVVVVATRPNLHVSGLTVTLEAMASGRPVVLTRTPGVEDYVEDGRTGLLGVVGDPSSVAERVLDLLADQDEAVLMGERARVVMSERFTTAHLADGLAGWMGLATASRG